MPTRELDYANLHAVMLYAQEGRDWIGEDAYSLPGIDPDNYRDLIKTTFFKLINAREGQRIRPPARDALPPGLSWSELQNAIKEKHAPIAYHLHSGIGLKLQRIDSDIAETVMLKLMEQNRLALPVHDSFITQMGQSTDALKSIMKDAYRDKMRAEIGIRVDPSAVDDALRIINADAQLGGEPMDAWDYVERQEQQPGYDGYRRRLRDFATGKTADWHERFGGP